MSDKPGMRRVVVRNDTPNDLWVKDATGALQAIEPGGWTWVWVVTVD